MGSRYCRTNARQRGSTATSANLFGPTDASRDAASAADRPLSAVTLRRSVTSPGSSAYHATGVASAGPSLAGAASSVIAILGLLPVTHCDRAGGVPWVPTSSPRWWCGPRAYAPRPTMAIVTPTAISTASQRDPLSIGILLPQASCDRRRDAEHDDAENAERAEQRPHPAQVGAVGDAGDGQAAHHHCRGRDEQVHEPGGTLVGRDDDRRGHVDE